MNTDKNLFQFQIVSVEKANDFFQLEGRCCSGNIKIGCQFNKIFRQEFRRRKNGFSEIKLQFESFIDAKVVDVRFGKEDKEIFFGGAGIIIISLRNNKVDLKNKMLVGNL